MAELKELLFQDIPIDFTPNPMTGNLTLLKNTDAIKNALKNLILTNFFSTPYNNRFGSDTVAQLFENFNSMSAHVLKKNIEVAVRNYEPRIRLIDIQINSERIIHNELTVTIVFIPINSKEPVRINIFLDRLR